MIRILLLLSLLLTGLAMQAQNNLLARRISISFEQTPIRTALNTVAQVGSFSLSYNPSIIDANKKVNLHVSNASVREVMLDILGNNYDLKVNGNYLILTQKSKPKEEVIGYIRNPNTGQGLSNVTVYDRKTLKATTTDSAGYYRLPVRDDGEILVARLGYRDTILLLTQADTNRYYKLELVPVEQNPVDIINGEIRDTYQRLTWLIGEQLDSLDLIKITRINVPDTIHRPIQFSLLPYVGTNHQLSDRVTNVFSVNLIGGVSAGTNGLEIGGVYNQTIKVMRGLQAASAANLNGGNTFGVQAAGVYNLTGDTLHGAQFSGAVNRCRQNAAHSFQAAGAVNLGGTNDAPINQAAGFMNKAQQTDYLQAAGCINLAENARGLQAAGLINVAQQVDGLQVAPMNKTQKLRGVQIGLVNYKNRKGGYQIGLINISKWRVLPMFNW